MRRAAAVIVAAALVTGCHTARAPRATPPPPDYASEDELTTALGAWLSCITRAEPAVDDMLSDAGTVAVVLAERCPDEFGVYHAAFVRGHDWRFIDAAHANEPKLKRDAARDVVLTERARRHAGKPPPGAK